MSNCCFAAIFLGNSSRNRMKIEHNVARLWVDCFDYQSNTVILGELVFRGRPQPVHKACHDSDKLFLCEDAKESHEVGNLKHWLC